ncbi:uncharacterized protein LOC111029967 [Myzus persicae]|uniref:uncharacterized protein LOC111029967 n=1 Tax=Myzus persicae TaxID=13164 RepID=UPI000B93094C|nr:uncharacterized protein LOC111029967 [Myzus persicae]
MCFDSNVVHIALHTSEMILEIADFEILNEKASCRNSDGAKKKWKNLRDTYAKELKKIPKPRSGADADNEPEYTGTWPYFESMSFLKVILKPRKQDGNIIEPEESAESYLMDSSESTCASLVDKFDTNTTQDNFDSFSQDDPQLQESELERSESVMTTEYETEARHDGLEAFIQLEKEKIQVLRQDQQDNNDDDLLWFKSMLPYMKKLPSLNKLRFRTQMQELLIKELSNLNKQQVPEFDSQNSFFPKDYETL